MRYFWIVNLLTTIFNNIEACRIHTNFKFIYKHIVWDIQDHDNKLIYCSCEFFTSIFMRWLSWLGEFMETVKWMTFQDLSWVCHTQVWGSNTMGRQCSVYYAILHDPHDIKSYQKIPLLKSIFCFLQVCIKYVFVMKI